MSPTAATIERAYRVRCYPTKQQARTLAELVGAKRFVWNWALSRRKEAYRDSKQNVSVNQLSRELTELRRQPEYTWLGALPRDPFTQVLRDLERAYSNFFRRAHPISEVQAQAVRRRRAFQAGSASH